MRIATWNVNGLRARLDFFRAWLRQRQPDVVGLQELKLETDQFPHAELAELGYRAVVHGQKSWNGVAVVTRHTAIALELGLPGQEDFGARWIVAEVAGVRVASVYCPNGKSLEHDDYQRKLAWYDTLTTHLHDRTGGGPLVVGGDFNICPAAIDSWDEAAHAGAIFHTDAERQRFAAVLGTGLRDSFRELYPEQQAFTWWDYRGGAFHRKHGLRIDFLLANATAWPRVRAVEIDREFRKKQGELTPSDHAPLWLELAD